MATIESPADDMRNHFGAPIQYADVQMPFNTARTVAGLSIATACLLTLTGGADTAWVWLFSGLAISADGLYRRNHGSSALPLILLDMTAVGVALLVSSRSPAVAVAVFVYVVTVSLLLLPLRRAAVAVAVAAAWVLPIGYMGTMLGSGSLSNEELFHQGFVAFVFTSLIAALLFTAGRSLHAAIEHQREALEAERRAGALKNEFVSMVSHELRTPLTSIAGFTDTLRDSWTSFGAAEIDEFLLIMRRETEHLQDLVEDILVIPRLEAGHLRLDVTDIDLRLAVTDSGTAVFTDPGTEFVVTIQSGVMVLADRVRLSQVLRNLLENARKYGGDQVLVDGDRDGDVFRITISDNGPGISEEDAERIFDHFEQVTKGDSRSASGVGLGLPIARRLVGAMGGTLWYEPRFPIGARFCFTLPIAAGLGQFDRALHARPIPHAESVVESPGR